jgi:hypothetical protein
MGLWEFLQQWRGGRAVGGVTASILLHLLVILAVLWGARLPVADPWKTKKGDALIVELPKPDESPAPGSPDVPASPPGPSMAPSAPSRAPAPPTPRTPPVAKPQPPAPPRVASAPRPPEPAAKPAPRPTEAPRPAEAPHPTPRPAETPAESADKGPVPESSSGAASNAATPKVERVPPGPPSNSQVASVPPGGASGQGLPDMRSALSRGAGGRGQGWAGIEGEPLSLDSPDPDFAPYLQKVKRQIMAKWVFPCLKNPVTHACDQYDAQLLVVFGIHQSGRLQVIDLQVSSGYALYDDYALTAVKLAAPYPPVPPAILAKFKASNIGLPIRAQFNYIVTATIGTLH